MSFFTPSPFVKSSSRTSQPGGIRLLVIVAVAFLIVNIAVGAVLIGSPAAHGLQEAKASVYD